LFRRSSAAEKMASASALSTVSQIELSLASFYALAAVMRGFS